MAVNKASRNERIKLLANTLNTIGLAFLVPGVVVPLVTLLYGAGLPFGWQLPYGGQRKQSSCTPAREPFSEG